MKTSILVGMTMLLMALPAAASDYTLEIFGNANEDNTINMQDVTYTELIILEYRDKTELADGKHDGKINMQDVTQIELTILGKEKELTVIDGADRTLTIQKPIKSIVVFRPYTLETMRSLKLENDKIIGVDKKGNQKWTSLPFSEFSDCPDVRSLFSPNYEAVLELHPDAV
ncbi:MAG: hypothetical protein U9N46_07150, partial [Euryarchaeota archaeon]|nr:hypothetical protein [Euryarchaeota archaeon]